MIEKIIPLSPPAAVSAPLVHLPELELQMALNQVEALTSEVAHLKIGLGTRGLIGMAIGITMMEHRLGEEQAFAYLTRLSSQGNIKLRVLAVGIVGEANSKATSPGTTGS